MAPTYSKQNFQQTVSQRVSLSGIGLHTGKVINITLAPAEVGSGVTFKRTDLLDQPTIPATVINVQDTSRNTTIGNGEARIHTVEHVLSAVRGCEVDNLLIEIDGPEPLVGDGSATPFVQMLDRARIVPQNAPRHFYQLAEPVFYTDGEVHLEARPHSDFKISYTLHYPNCKLLQNQSQTFTVNPAVYRRDIAPCRTFGLYDEMEPLMKRGLIQGGSLANSVIIDGTAVFSSDGLIFPNEPVRHKILDLIGDLALIGRTFHAHVIAKRSGHTAHYKFAKKFQNRLVPARITGKSTQCDNPIEMT